MPLTRRTWTDDDGSGTTGTILNNAELQRIYDDVDPLSPATSTITTTGTQTALALPAGINELVIFANNATLLTLQGIAAGEDGQRITIFSKGAGRVDIVNQNASASAVNRIITGGGTTITLAPGTGRASLLYDLTTARWRVDVHGSDTGAGRNLFVYSTFGGF